MEECEAKIQRDKYWRLTRSMLTVVVGEARSRDESCNLGCLIVFAKPICF